MSTLPIVQFAMSPHYDSLTLLCLSYSRESEQWICFQCSHNPTPQSIITMLQSNLPCSLTGYLNRIANRNAQYCCIVYYNTISNTLFLGTVQSVRSPMFECVSHIQASNISITLLISALYLYVYMLDEIDLRETGIVQWCTVISHLISLVWRHKTENGNCIFIRGQK